MAVTVPSWFKGRQGKADEAGPGVLRLTAPNLKEWFLGLRRLDDGHWHAFLRSTADGPDEAAVGLEAMPAWHAWEAAFEVYRNHVIV
jgi:hypothetical protein